MAYPYGNRISNLTNSIEIIGPRGNTLSVEATGEGPTLMLLHGFAVDHRMWHNQMSQLASRFHLIAVQLRGFGKSTLDEANFSLAELAQDVEFLRKHLAGDEAVHLAGLSMGGCVAFEYWRQFSQHLASLILVCTKPTTENAEGNAGRRAMAAKALSEGTWPAVQPMLARLLAQETQANRPEIVEQVVTMMRDMAPATVVACQEAMVQRRDFTDLLGSIRTRTLVVAGEDDVITPAKDAQTWSACIPNSQYHGIQKAGHLAPLEQPDEFNSVVTKFCG